MSASFSLTPQHISDAGAELARAFELAEQLAAGDERRLGEIKTGIIAGTRQLLLLSGCSPSESMDWLDVVLRAARRAADLNQAPPMGRA